MSEIVIYNAANAAGRAAVVALKVTPMVVTQHSNPLDDSSAIRKAYFVEDGPCGFAYVTIKPANSRFAKFMVVNGLARKAYGGGVTMSVRDYNQSLQKKEAYAYAFAKVLQDNGIKAYAESRMD